LEFDAVAGLKGDAEHGKLYELLLIVSAETMPAYTKWAGANGAYITKVGLKAEDLVVKMRLLSLCTAAAASRIVKYSEVAAAMDIPEADVEKWMIKAFTSKLITAKMDQESRTVI
jgi:translation initiation factor 3 subunit M